MRYMYKNTHDFHESGVAKIWDYEAATQMSEETKNGTANVD